MAAIDDLEAKVAAEETVIASAEALLTELNTELKAALAAGDPTALEARITALSAKLDTDTSALSAAVAANTPADAPPATTPAAPTP